MEKPNDYSKISKVVLKRYENLDTEYLRNLLTSYYVSLTSVEAKSFENEHLFLVFIPNMKRELIILLLEKTLFSKKYNEYPKMSDKTFESLLEDKFDELLEQEKR
jgi:hypothetical protein